VDTKKILRTIAFLLTDDETFDVGVDTRSGVNDADYHVPIRFTGTINKLTVKPGGSNSRRMIGKSFGTACWGPGLGDAKMSAPARLSICTAIASLFAV
jgi:hypothetical protein